MKDNIITIDGPSASGKGSLARNIAAHLNFDILDSGLLYRVYAYLYDCGLEHSKIVAHIKKDIFFKTDLNGLTIHDGKEDITGDLRSEKTAKAASKISSLNSVLFSSIVFPFLSFLVLSSVVSSFSFFSISFKRSKSA